MEQNVKNNAALKMDKSLSGKMILTVTAILVGLVLAVGLVNMYIIRKELLAAYDELLYHKSVDSSRIVSEQLENYITSIETLGTLSVVSNPEIPVEEKIETLKLEKDLLIFPQ